MTDVVTKEKRSQMMSGIKGKDTKPELKIRKALHARGFRYSLHKKGLPGKPDIVLPKYNAIIFVHGCFWHLHECHLFKWPSTRPDFWKTKITLNKEKDAENIKLLKNAGWKVLIIWECALKGKFKLEHASVVQKTCDWIKSDIEFMEIRGTK